MTSPTMPPEGAIQVTVTLRAADGRQALTSMLATAESLREVGAHQLDHAVRLLADCQPPDPAAGVSCDTGAGGVSFDADSDGWAAAMGVDYPPHLPITVALEGGPHDGRTIDYKPGNLVPARMFVGAPKQGQAGGPLDGPHYRRSLLNVGEDRVTMTYEYLVDGDRGTAGE